MVAFGTNWQSQPFGFNAVPPGYPKAAGGGFTPASLAPTLWIEPSDLASQWADTGATTPATVGGAVARSNDKSANGNNAVQANGSQQPVLRNPNGSIYTHDFDGTDDAFSLAALTASINTGGKFSCVIGLRGIGTGVARGVVGQYRTSGNQRSWRLIKDASAMTYKLAASSDGTGTTLTTSASSIAATETVFAVVSNGTNAKFYQGLTLVDTVPIIPFAGTAPLDIAGDGGAGFADIEIAHLVYRAGVDWTDAQRIAATQYAAQKTGVSL